MKESGYNLNQLRSQCACSFLFEWMEIVFKAEEIEGWKSALIVIGINFLILFCKIKYYLE